MIRCNVDPVTSAGKHVRSLPNRAPPDMPRRLPPTPAFLDACWGGLRRRFGPEPARTVLGVLLAALLLAFYVLYVATHLDR